MHANRCTIDNLTPILALTNGNGNAYTTYTLTLSLRLTQTPIPNPESKPNPDPDLSIGNLTLSNHQEVEKLLATMVPFIVYGAWGRDRGRGFTG